MSHIDEITALLNTNPWDDRTDAEVARDEAIAEHAAVDLDNAAQTWEDRAHAGKSVGMSSAYWLKADGTPRAPIV